MRISGEVLKNCPFVLVRSIRTAALLVNPKFYVKKAKVIFHKILKDKHCKSRPSPIGNKTCDLSVQISIVMISMFPKIHSKKKV